MEETIRKISAIFDKMASVKITPTSNYAVHEYWMNRALKGDEKCKDTLFNWLSGILRVDKSVLNAVFNAKYNKTNENKEMNKKIIRLTEGDLHRIVKESVQMILNESPSLNSPKLYQIAKEHGGISYYRGLIVIGDGYCKIPISMLTDDLLADEVVPKSDTEHGLGENCVRFNDGTCLPITDPEAVYRMYKAWKTEVVKDGRYAKRPQSDLSKLRGNLRRAKDVLSTHDPRTSTIGAYWYDWNDNARQSIKNAYKNGEKIDYQKIRP